jgi:hypothetical protein
MCYSTSQNAFMAKARGFRRRTAIGVRGSLQWRWMTLICSAVNRNISTIYKDRIAPFWLLL